MWIWVAAAGGVLWVFRHQVLFLLVIGYLFYLHPFFALFFGYFHCSHTRVTCN